MSSMQVASQVLDYWFAIEFLAQDSYDTCTNESKLVRELKQFKKADMSTKNKRKQISVFESIEASTDIYKQILNQSNECGMSICGNLTFYIGRIPRQACIEKLAQELGLELEQGEKNSEYIPILSFQCNPKGEYLENTLSLSTIMWAVSQVEGKKNGRLSTLLSSKVYSEVLKEMEKKFFGTDEHDKKENIEVEVETFSLEGMPSFSEDAISASKIVSIHSEIIKMYGGFFSEGTIEEKNGIKYQLFKDIKSRDKYDDDNYMGLSHDFFSNDLKMVKDSIEEKDDFSIGMLSDLIDYICAPHKDCEKGIRHDFVKPKDKDVFYGEVAEILNIGNAPLGKWPSRYMPALMQQIAVNIATSSHARGIFGENGNIFSVNGPPGTGKTTLLKEVIANNIVEKAVVLSQYNSPDDAFEGVKFVGGEFDGAYVKYYPKWYRFKDDHVADFGVLVTSCNNTAVENITKELPLENGILDNLKVICDGGEKDSLEMTRQLEEIRKHFASSETKNKINIYKKDTKRQGDYPEIYFTGYAKKFFGNDEKDADAWGLIAAPLGKKSNISGFYYDVLNPIWQDFMMKNDDIESREVEYRKAREAFINQLKIVREIQKELKWYGDIVFESHRSHLVFKHKEKENNKLIASKENEIKSLEKKIKDVKTNIGQETSRLQKLVSLVEEADFKVKSIKKRMQELSDQELNFKKQALNAEKSVSIFTKIFRQSKYQVALELAETCRTRAKEYTDAIEKEAKEYAKEKEAAERYFADKENALRQVREFKDCLENLEGKQLDAKKIILKMTEEINQTKRIMETAKAECNSKLKDYITASDTETGKILDKKFIEDILSNDDKIATKAQVTNPWSTEKFNREREKLFYLSLQMTKEFVLSSKSCRANLCILGQYWGLRTETGTDKIRFSKLDREAMIDSLFQTLFLVTPVVSSTFASVGRLLRDMKKPRSIGTLVIDEAGQAQPQMAVGALYRARKAIIVGDPKQVEPVVTDDLKLLKEAYSESVYQNYKNKSLSVQTCADALNPFGTFYENGTKKPEWVGCPLLVHRRCISPMYEISNHISYNDMMKQQTLQPSEKKIKTFICRTSKWINVTGREIGHGNHYVVEQGDAICKLVDCAFRKAIDSAEGKNDVKPNLYIITPFTSVVSELRKTIGTFANRNKESALAESTSLGEWLYDNIGTVHKFQGKEANEVIFALGCDETLKDRYAVKGFVNSNIVNVAATRAKYRLYIVGDFAVWKMNENIKEAKSIIDLFSGNSNVEQCD